MKCATYSMHRFDRERQHLPFSPSEYAMFKHGSIRIAKIMGLELAHSFFQNYVPLRYIEKQIVIFPSPYYFIPSAAALMTKFFLIEFNKLLVSQKKKPAIISHIMRELTYHEDYGKMDSSNRETLISGDKFYVDHNYLKDKHSIYIDDIRITGAHERQIDKLLGNTSTDYTFLYYAEDLSQDPKTEDFLNHYNMRISKDLFYLLSNEACVFNVRNMRVLLTMDELVFTDYVSFTSQCTLYELYNLAIGNQYHNVTKYAKNVNILKHALK